MLTGIVTTNDVIVSPQIAGQIAQLLVKEGDQVKNGQLLAVIAPDELQADTAYYAQNAEGLSSQVRESRGRAPATAAADRRIRSRQAEVDARSRREAQVKAATADLENARARLTRARSSWRSRASRPRRSSTRRARRTTPRRRKLDSLEKQVDAQRSAVALARANAEQVAARRSQLETSQHMQAAAAAQRTKADVRLRYTEIHAPIDGIVDVRAARVGRSTSRPGSRS